MERKVILSTLVSLSLLGISACNTDNKTFIKVADDNTTTSLANEDKSFLVDGKVIDGYIKGSTICIDKNFNSECDPNERKTTTKEDGSYSLKLQSDELKYPLIAYGGVNTATQKDFNGILKSSPISMNITPLTTFEEELKDKGASKEEAKEKLASLLGVKIEDLTKDYIALAKKEDKLYKAALKVQKSAELIDPENPLKGYDILVDSLQKGAKNFEELLDNAPLDETLKSNIKTLLQTIDTLESINLEENIEIVKEKIIQAQKEKKEVKQEDILKELQQCQLNPNLDDSDFEDTPPNNGIDIPYFTIGERVSDIEAAFNRARAFDETINTKLELPSQSVWDKMSAEEQALYILNKERVARGLKPFEGVEAMNVHFSKGEPKTLADVAQAYANLLYTKKELSHNFDGSVSDRINRVKTIKDNQEYIPYNESLYAGGSNFKYDEVPLVKAIYNWIYADSNPSVGGPWEHRAMCLMRVDNDNFGEKGAEGILAFGLKQGENYAAYPSFKSSIVVMNAFNPTSSWKGAYKKLSLCKGINTQDDRFKRESNGVIIDTKTKLIWQDINLTKGTQEDLEKFCSNLTLEEYNWRAPSAKELSEYYKAALKVGVTPNLSQINMTTLTASDGFVVTQEGVKKYKKALGTILTEFNENHIGDIRCVVGEKKEDIVVNDKASALEIKNSLIIDKSNNLAFINNNKLAGRLNNYYGKIACDNLELEGYSDWRLPTSEELSILHKKAQKENRKLNYYASYCTYETTNEIIGDGYKAVRVQKANDNYAIGDIVSFSGSSGVRCVRENITQDMTKDTQAPKKATIVYSKEDLRELKESQNGITTNIYLNINLDGDCEKIEGTNRYHCPSISFDINGEANTKVYTLDKKGALAQEIGILSENGKITISIDNQAQEYSYLESEKAGNRYSSSLGEVVLVDESNNISLPVQIWINFFPIDKN